MVDSISRSKIDEIRSTLEKHEKLDWGRIPDSYSLAFSIDQGNFFAPSCEPADLELPADYAYLLNSIGPLLIYRDEYQPIIFGPPQPLGHIDLSFEECDSSNDDPRLRYLPDLVLHLEVDRKMSVADWAGSIGISDWLMAGVYGNIFTRLWGYSTDTSPPQSAEFCGVDPQSEEWEYRPLSFIEVLSESFFDLPEIKLLRLPEFSHRFFEQEEQQVAVLSEFGGGLRFLNQWQLSHETIRAALSNDPWAIRFLQDRRYRQFMKDAMINLRGTDYRFPYAAEERNLTVGLLESIPDVGEENFLQIVGRSG